MSEVTRRIPEAFLGPRKTYLTSLEEHGERVSNALEARAEWHKQQAAKFSEMATRLVNRVPAAVDHIKSVRDEIISFEQALGDRN